MAKCIKNHLFPNGAALPKCSREATHRVTILTDAGVQVAAVCAPCTALFERLSDENAPMIQIERRTNC